MLISASDSSLSAVSREETLSPRVPIIFFDGVCGFCNRTVNWVLRHDSRRAFLLAPLQGEHSRRLIEPAIRENLASVVLLVNGKSYFRSAAVCRILMLLGGFWYVAGMLLWLIPLPLRDLGYRIFGRYRYLLFGKLEACRIPTLEERDRFLD